MGSTNPRMTVKAGPQSLLIQEMGNQTDTTSQNEETVQDTKSKVFISFFWGKGTAVSEQVNKADSNATIDVENQIILL